MSYPTENIDKDLEAIALEVVTLEKDDIPAMGNILKVLCRLEEICRMADQPLFLDLVSALKGYLERVVLKDLDDLEPLEEGIDRLQSMHRSLSNGEEYKEDLFPLFKRLGFSKAGAGEVVQARQGKGQAEPAAGEVLSAEDLEILRDFVTESVENLATIEACLMDLEQDPEDSETINAIFRPFHTIKGVSGFLNLGKINRLAHSAENLLDKARDGKIRIEGEIVDIILAAVDDLKKMILNVQDALEKGGPPEGEYDIAPLVDRIQYFNSRSEEVGDKLLGEILVGKGAADTATIEQGLEDQRLKPGRKIGEILIKKGAVESKEVLSALREQKSFGRQKVDLQVKVDTKKLDALVDMTGELVIAQSMLRQNRSLQSANDQKLNQNLNQLNHIVSGLQRTAMSMRMVQIRSTFQKMVRLVRDLARQSGKEVRLVMSGEETEIDRNVVEELYEPMVHMIRNAVDHGIEIPAERRAAGKDGKGTIYLKAYRQGGNIVIEINDDGKGLDKARIIEKARSSHLITGETVLTDSEIYNLIFRPGFSTAMQVTDISGRGVGMDVVKRAIDKLRGRVEIQSRPGLGSTFFISLPLTLAIIDGMLVRVGRERYIIPALSILESFRPKREQYATVQETGEMILSRGNLFPLIRLDRIFGIEGDTVNPWEGLVMIVESDGERRCLLLDELLGKEEVVIKSMGKTFKDIQGVAGGAIMGDGRVGLILDMSGLFAMVGE